MNVFIENEANKSVKNIFDEKTLEYKKSVEVSAPYPFAYGFILNTTSGDGDNLDCFVLTDNPLKTGQTVDIEPIGMLEMLEDGELDHKIIARFNNERNKLNDEAKERLVTFLNNVFAHIPGKNMEIGRFLGVEDAKKLIRKCLDN
jgi:inorganic pyrophosphatase